MYKAKVTEQWNTAYIDKPGFTIEENVSLFRHSQGKPVKGNIRKAEHANETIWHIEILIILVPNNSFLLLLLLDKLDFDCKS